MGVHVDGGYADYVCLPAGNFLPIPSGLSYEDAAIAADAVNTNWHCMRERAQISPHDDVLLIGAGGGVGVHGIQVAKAFGARVIAADISDEKLEFARKWGADEVINVRAVNDLAEASHVNSPMARVWMRPWIMSARLRASLRPSGHWQQPGEPW